MESKIINHIEFKFTRAAYPSSEKLFCYFGTTSHHIPQVGDWVGLFRVGWKNLKEHHVRKYVSFEALEISKKVNIDYTHVVFENIELPKERDTYYQFVYVTKGENVRGISRPFQIEVEQVELKDELKEFKREMWSTMEERDMWSKMVSEEREKEREIYEKMREIKEKSREQRQRERVREREREEREREERERENSLFRRVRKPDTVKIVEKLETELMKEKRDRKPSEDESIVSKLIQRYLSSVRSKKDEDFSKRFEELFVENNKLSSSLRSRIQEVAELQKECEELKSENQELGYKLTNGERKQRVLERELEREREVIRKRLEEQREQVLPSLYERSGKQSLDKLVSEFEDAKFTLIKEENERLRDELRRLSTLYQTESTNHSSLKHKLLKIDETLSKREIVDNESTLYEVKALKKLIDELRSENEVLKSKFRYENEYVRPESTTTTSKTTIIKEKSMLPRVNSQPEYISLIETKPYGQQDSYPSISISTSQYPEVTTSKSSVTLNGKPIREQLSESLSDIFMGKIEEQLKKKSIEEHLKSKLEKLKLIELNLKDLKDLKETPVEMVISCNKPDKLTSFSFMSNPNQVPSEETIQKQLKRQHQKYFLQQYEEQAKQNLKEQLSTSQYNIICPVCGIAVSKELNQTEFELHVNSHFTD